MKREDAEALRLLGYDPERCAQIGNLELGRHAIYASGDEIIKFYGMSEGISAEARARAECKFSALARERGVKAPVILRHGEAAGKHYTVSERLPGTPIPEGEGQEIWREIGRLLGAFHAPILQDGGPWLEKWLAHCLDCARTALNNPCGERAARAINSAAQWLEEAACPPRFTLLPMGACHGDFYPRNMLLENGHVSGLIDFELASEGNVELELSKLARAELSGRPERSAAFRAGYRESAYLAPDFMSRLPLYLVGEALFACSWSFRAVPEYFQASADWLELFLLGRARP